MDRRTLADEPRLGGGSILEFALALCVDPEAPFLFSERPLLDPTGRRRTRFSLSEVDSLAQRWSSWYLEEGIGPRDRVAIYLEDSFDDVLQFFALTQIGAIPVLINGGLDAELAVGLYRRTGAVGMYTDAKHLAAIGNPDEVNVLAVADRITDAGRGRLAAPDRYRHGSDDPVLISHSSGTTGVPKAVVWTHEASVAGLRHLLRQPAWEGPMLSAVPQSHQAGPSFAFGALLFGCPLIALADRSGENVAAAIARHRPTTVAAFSQTYAQLAALDPDPQRLSSVQRWFNTGDSAHGRHIARLVRTGSEFIDGLGSSELGFAQFYRITTSGTVRHDRCVGRPQPFAEVAVLRSDGTESEVGEVGLLGVKSPTITPGYWNDSDLTYRSRLRGYFLSGDLVYRDDQGQYFHMDRAVDVVHTATGPAYSLLMEEILLGELPQLADSSVIGVPGPDDFSVPVAVLQLQDSERYTVDPNELLSAVNQVLRRAGQPEVAMVHVANTATDIPVGPSGKVLKRRLRERFQNVLINRAPDARRAYADAA